MAKSIIDLNYCKNCGNPLSKLDDCGNLCEDCNGDTTPIKIKEDDDGSCCIKDDETELEPDYLDDDEGCFCRDDD